MRPAPRPERPSATAAAAGASAPARAWASATPMRRTAAASRFLKILLTNSCIFDCAYCINRKSSNVRRARFTAEEVVRPHARLLQAQLHRGPVPVLRHHPLVQLHDGADRRGRAVAARGPRFSRLHPPEDDPRRRSGAGATGGPLCRPRLDQRRAADAQRASPRWRPKRTSQQIEDAMGDMKAAIADAGDAAKRFKSAPGLRARRPVDPDDRRRRRAPATRDIVAQGEHALRPLRPHAASIIRRSARSRTPSAVLPLEAAAADARAPALPVRLADAVLRLRAEGSAERGR